MFRLVPAHPGSPGQRAVKRLLLLILLNLSVQTYGYVDIYPVSNFFSKKNTAYILKLFAQSNRQLTNCP